MVDLRWLHSLCLATVLLVGCGGEGVAPEVEGEDGSRVGDLAGEGAGHDAMAGDLGAAEAALEVEEVGDEPDLGPQWVSLCGQPEAALCPEPGPKPDNNAGIQAFAANNAIRLRCLEAGDGLYDFTVFLREFEDRQIFFMGEVHGSNEIGPASAELFEALVRQAGVSVLALEIGVDTSEAMNRYVETGEVAAAQEFGIDMYSANMFRRVLPDRARELRQLGYQVKLYGVDVPQRLAWVNEQLEELASSVVDGGLKSLMLEKLPPPREIASYGMMGIEKAYVDQAKAYYDHIKANLETLCPALAAEQCVELEYLAYSLWIGAVFVSQEFMMASMGGGDQAYMMKMMMEREKIMLHLFKQALPEDGIRGYAHMGTAHAAQGGWNVAGQLARYHAPSLGRVYSATPAYGPDSAIFYGIMTQKLPAEPKVIGETLAKLPEDRYYLSTGLPGLDCTANPFADYLVPELGGQYGTSWNAFFFYRQLTADKPGGWGFIPLTPRQQFFRSQSQRMRYANELLSRYSASENL